MVITGAISEVKFEGGSAKATSCHPAPWTAEKAFILGHINAWQAGRQPGAQKTEWAIFPTMIWSVAVLIFVSRALGVIVGS